MPTHQPKRKWNSTAVPCLLRHESGKYYARLRKGRKQVWHSLQTTVFSIAKVRLTTWLQEQRKSSGGTGTVIEGSITVGEAARQHLLALDQNVQIKDTTRHYWRQIVNAVFKDWPDLPTLDVRRVRATDCRAWASKFSTKRSATRYNNSIAALRHILDRAVQAGVLVQNPAQTLNRRRVLQKELVLPEMAQFEAFVRSIRTAGAWCSQACADLVEFLAYTGCRVGEARMVHWRDVDLQRGVLTVRGKPKTGTKNGEIRRVPLIPAARVLLERLNDAAHPPAQLEPVLAVHECQRAMNNAAQKVGMARITHHDLRHLFATACIEAGTDIPTVSRWLGHKDGGVLAMKTYGHLRDEHSQASAARVHFTSTTKID